MEKPAILSIYLLEKVIKEILGDSFARKTIRHLVVISDNGYHLKAYRVLDWILLHVANTYRINTSWCYGLANHVKGLADAVQPLEILKKDSFKIFLKYILLKDSGKET